MLKRNSLLSLFAIIALALFSSAWAPGLEGVVRNADGEPVEGLRVQLFIAADIQPDAPAETLVTGADGRFRTENDYDAPVVLEVGAGRILIDPAAAPEPVEIGFPVREEIFLLHDNDLHFDFNHLEEFRQRVEHFRARHNDVFLLNAGDVFTRYPGSWRSDDGAFAGEPEWYRNRAVWIIETMNELGYDAMTLGNHELDPVEHHTRETLERARFPLLAANVNITTELLPKPEATAILRTSTGRSIAVLGLTTGIQREGIEIGGAALTAPRYAHLADEHDVVVGLTHVGIVIDGILAWRCPWIDVIIGGHSHTLLTRAQTVNGALIAHAGGSPHPVSVGHPKYLGIVRIILEDGAIVEKDGHVLELAAPVEALAEEAAR